MNNYLLQFTAGGHMLGFTPEGIYIAAGDHALRVEFVHCSISRPVAAADSSQSKSAAPLDKVTYRNVWKNVDLVYTPVANGIAESTYYLNIPACADNIRLFYNQPVSLDSQGNLVISFDNGTMVESAPIAWQEIEGSKQAVDSSYIIYNKHEIGFALSGCQPGIPVVIDPVLTWNTFLGGNLGDSGNAIAVDAMGNIYVAGTSNAAWGNPLRAYSGNGDAFVAKLNTSGALIWLTFLGGSESDQGNGIILDRNGYVCVTGTSHDTWGSPVRQFPGGIYQPFVARLSNNGALQWNTFLGGGSWGKGRGVVTDAAGSIYVAGDSYSTWGSPVRAHSGAWNDAFTAKLDSSGSLFWITFLGGPGDDTGLGITVNAAGNVYIVGNTDNLGAPDDSWGTPIRSYSHNDAFIAALSNNGALVWNTFLGGVDNDFGKALAIDAGSNLYVCGTSDGSWDVPFKAFSGNSDAFVARLTGSGNLAWHTFAGGNGYDNGYGIAVNDGSIFITGASSETWGDSERPFAGGDWDCFVAGISNGGALLWNTFLGGAGADFGYGVSVDPGNNVYIAGESYDAWGTPVRPYTPGTGGMDTLRDAFVAKLPGNLPSINSFTPTSGGNRTEVIITGNNFIGATSVNFGDITASAFMVNSNNQITATIGNGNPGRITVTTPSGTATSTTPFNFAGLLSPSSHGGSSTASGTTTANQQGPVPMASISVQSASLSTNRVVPGAPVTITVGVVNTGNAEGTNNIIVYVNGQPETNQGVTVKSGSSTPITFTVSRNEPGTYSVYVGGTSAGSFTVDAMADPNIILYISGAMVLLSLVIGLLFILRRRKAQ
ncbi:MAG: SBBP repeat-containing protein [Dehalococcoidia bacterium]|nr:SBBP repeat-containing protein [Dehalococcoidia bacterium]